MTHTAHQASVHHQRETRPTATTSCACVPLARCSWCTAYPRPPSSVDCARPWTMSGRRHDRDAVDVQYATQGSRPVWNSQLDKLSSASPSDRRP